MGENTKVKHQMLNVKCAEVLTKVSNPPRRPLGTNAGVSKDLHFTTNSTSLPNYSTPPPLTLSMGPAECM